MIATSGFLAALECTKFWQNIVRCEEFRSLNVAAINLISWQVIEYVTELYKVMPKT